MNDDIETPNGWERQGSVFTRLHDGKFAVLERGTPEDALWWARIYQGRMSPINIGWKPLAEAVACAEKQLGVPKPVEVVRIVCEDAILEYSSDLKRSARYEPLGIGSADVAKRERRYVRGGA